MCPLWCASLCVVASRLAKEILPLWRREVLVHNQVKALRCALQHAKTRRAVHLQSCVCLTRLLSDELARPVFDGMCTWRGSHDMATVQAEDIEALEAYLRRLDVPTRRQLVVEGGVEVTQLFFHDPGAPQPCMGTCTQVHRCEDVAPVLRSHAVVNAQAVAPLLAIRNFCKQRLCEHKACMPCAHHMSETHRTEKQLDRVIKLNNMML